MSIFTVVTTPSFESQYAKLKKRYPKIDDDFEDFLNEVEIDGELGEDIQGRGPGRKTRKIYAKQIST